jgi:hypothetical protein
MSRVHGLGRQSMVHRGLGGNASCHTQFLCQSHILIICMTQDELFHTYRTKVFTDNQLSWIKYNYYINNISKDYDDSTKRNSGSLHNSTGTATEVAHSLELLVKEFQSIFSFWAVGLSSRGEIARLSTLMVDTQQVQKTNDMWKVISR